MTRVASAEPAVLLAGLLGLLGCADPADDGGQPADPAQLAPPPPGQGVQISSEDIDVPLGTEQQDCYFFKVSELARAGGLDPNQPLNLHRVEVAQRIGSHHLNIFRVRTIVKLGPEGGLVQKGSNGAGECFKSGNWGDWPLVTNSQSARVDWTYPDGVANVFAPDEWLMLQTHWVNGATQQTDSKGRVRVNFWTIPTSAVKAELGTIFATKQSIRVCRSNPAPTFQGSCQFNSPDPVHVIGANGHFHSRGKTFDIYSWNGVATDLPPASDRFYRSTEWSEPPMLHSPALDVTVPARGGIWYTCAFEWRAPDRAVGCEGLDAYDQKRYMTPAANLDCCYTFGPIVEMNEHCNGFVYYYPKRDDTNCF